MYVPLREFAEKFNIPLQWDSNTQVANLDLANKRIEVSDEKFYKEEGVIPDKKTALAVGKVILESYCGREVEYTDGMYTFFLVCTYNPVDRYWYVQQEALKNGEVFYGLYGLGKWGCPTITLNQSTGEVAFISASFDFWDGLNTNN